MIGEEAPARPGTGVYVYGIVRSGAVQPPVRLVEHGRLAAVVRDVPAGWRAASRSDLEVHDRVLAGLLAGTVIPMRFGVVMDSDEEVRERLLERHADELERLLEQLDGRVQMSVKAYYVDEGLLRAVLRRRPDLKRRSDALERTAPERSQPERIALGKDVAAAVEEQREMDQDALLEPLAALAEDVRVEPPAGDRQALNLQLLVDAGRRPELDALVRRLTDEHGSRFAFRYVGPVAPYSFADVQWDS